MHLRIFKKCILPTAYRLAANCQPPTSNQSPTNR